MGNIIKIFLASAVFLIGTIFGSELNFSEQTPSRDSTFEQSPTLPPERPSPTSFDKEVETKMETSNFIYPDSDIIERQDDAVELKSRDNPERITSWYKEKLKVLKMNAKSFSQTTSNGNILNNLVAANGKETISVKIEKSVSDRETTIDIKIDPVD